ncbi:MAG: CBS domain-containing protein [Bacteroidetes bacterium]|nr:CBS domain-containing protein [Bacteroidota bacterium]
MEVNDPVSTIISRPVIVANQSHHFSEVLELFSQHGRHHLPVVNDENHLIGIISTSDLLKLFYDPRFTNLTFNRAEIDSSLKLTDIMTPDPITIASTETIEKAARLFTDHKIQCLPVVDNGELTGIVTIKDLAQLVAYF